ncbi:MAG: type VI secretion system baseplate subunit TssE [Pseudomonadota bacterium]
MTQRFKPSVWDRLLAAGDGSADGPFTWSLDQLKDAVARDLEDLLNTRSHMSQEDQLRFPAVAASIYNYGLMDFSSMCLNSEEDRNKICAAVKLAIERFEPRLHCVSAELRVHRAPLNRVDFVISAMLKCSSEPEPVCFDAVMHPSTQHYSVRKLSEQPTESVA